jgi:hypothetical protein
MALRQLTTDVSAAVVLASNINYSAGSLSLLVSFYSHIDLHTYQLLQKLVHTLTNREPSALIHKITIKVRRW